MKTDLLRMRPIVRRYSLLAVAVFFILFSSAAAQQLTIISPHWEGIQHEYSEAFKEWHLEKYGEPGEIEWMDQGGTSDDFRFIKSEFSRSPDGIGVDIFWGGGVDPYNTLSSLGLLESYRLPDTLLNAIPATIYGIPLYAKDFTWYGTALSGFGILRNRVVMDMMKLPDIRSWKDLTDPRLQSWVGGADPRSSGSAHMCYEIMLQAYGWEKGWEILTLTGGNIRAFTKGSNQAPKDVAVGEVAFGLVIDLYAWNQIQEVGGGRIDYILPEGHTVINPDAIGILKGAPHPVLARRFLEFVLSPAGQALLLLPPGTKNGPRKEFLGRMPVIPALYDQYEKEKIIDINPFTYTKSFPYDSDKGSARWGVINDLIGIFLIDLHRELVTAWKLVIKSGRSPELIRRLVEMPLSEPEAMELSKNWRDQVFRNRKIAEWTSFARNKYKSLIKELD